MWNSYGRWIELDWAPARRNGKTYASTYLAKYLTNGEKEDTEHVSVQNELKKVAEITKNEIAKEWTREYVNSFCSVKSIEVSVDHRTVVVIWTDGDKTIVKRSEKDPDDIYMAFTAALAKKVYGSNSAIKRLINKKVNEHKPKEKKETERVVRQKKREATE